MEKPLTLKRDGVIPQLIQQHNPGPFLQGMTMLSNGNELIPEYLRLMERYNLLPNDALILATCRLHNLTQLASHDLTDFGPACVGEGISLVSEVNDLT